jgi:hypothetical protein
MSAFMFETQKYRTERRRDIVWAYGIWHMAGEKVPTRLIHGRRTGSNTGEQVLTQENRF